MPTDESKASSESSPDEAPEIEDAEYEILDVPATPDEDLEQAKALTKARARDLRALLGKYIRRHLPRQTTTPAPVPEPPRTVGAHARLLPLLQVVPWTLGAIFVLSFIWDFPGVTLTAFGYTLPLDGVLLVTSVSGLIGFFTNWLAITMLFHPRHKRPIIGQGLIPAQRERVIYRMARAVSDELINEKIIKQKIEESQVIPKYREMALSVTHGVLEDPDFRAELKQLTADYVDTVLGSEEVRRKIVAFTIQKIEEHTSQTLSGLALKAYRFINEEDFQRRIDTVVRDLPRSLDTALDQMDHLLDRLPETLAERSEEIEQWATKIILGFVENLDVYSMIISNMRQYDEQKLEMLLKNTSNEQLNYIKYLGGVLGFFGGLVIWKPLLALGLFSALGLILYAVDELLYRSRASQQT